MIKEVMPDIPGGPVVKNLSAHAGDVGWTPGSGRFHMLGATKPMHHDYGARALESTSHNRQSPRACAPRGERRLHSAWLAEARKRLQ